VRIAYLSGSNLRLVAGDGTGDRRIDSAQDVAPAWRPSAEHVLAYANRSGAVTVLATDENQTLWTAGGAAVNPEQLEWSADATRLLVSRRLPGGQFALVVFDADGRRRQTLAFDGQFVAVVRRLGLFSELLVVAADTLRQQQVVFRGRGRFSDVAWSPNGRWLLLGWESAGQWLFIRSTDVSKVEAVESLATQFDPGGTGTGEFPRIEGWCCPG
jgi:hypothetical protein